MEEIVEHREHFLVPDYLVIDYLQVFLVPVTFKHIVVDAYILWVPHHVIPSVHIYTCPIIRYNLIDPFVPLVDQIVVIRGDQLTDQIDHGCVGVDLILVDHMPQQHIRSHFVIPIARRVQDPNYLLKRMTERPVTQVMTQPGYCDSLLVILPIIRVHVYLVVTRLLKRIVHKLIGQMAYTQRVLESCVTGSREHKVAETLLL